MRESLLHLGYVRGKFSRGFGSQLECKHIVERLRVKIDGQTEREGKEMSLGMLIDAGKGYQNQRDHKSA